MVSGMLVLAHRGANRLAPENTVPAMQEAIDRGADGVELDVHRTADGELVVRHDAETPVGPLGELSTADLRRALPDAEAGHYGNNPSTDETDGTDNSDARR